MVIKTSINAVEYYLSLMMSVWFNHHDVEPEVLEGYKEGAIEIKGHMKKWNDQKYIQLAFAYLIESDTVSSEIWDDFEDSCNYSFVEFEFKEIIEYAYSIIWPDISPKDVLKGYDVEFIKTGIELEEWHSIRDSMNALDKSLNP